MEVHWHFDTIELTYSVHDFEDITVLFFLFPFLMSSRVRSGW